MTVLEQMAGPLDEGGLRVEEEAVLPLEEAASARWGERGGRRGKLVLEVR